MVSEAALHVVRTSARCDVEARGTETASFEIYVPVLDRLEPRTSGFVQVFSAAAFAVFARHIAWPSRRGLQLLLLLFSGVAANLWFS